jgi:Putative metallopeptidase
MRCSLRVLAVAAAAIFACLHAVQACAQDNAKPGPSALPSKVDIAYKEPPKSKPEFQPIYTKLQQKRVLEQLQQFLAPLKLKRNLEVMTAECQGSFYLPYKPQGPVTICYEFVQLIDTVADDRPWGIVGSSVVTRDMFTVGPFVQEVLHNVALAVFDIQEIPVWGNAEFAADNVAAFLMLQFGTDVAMKTVLGSAFFLNQLETAAARNTLDYLGDIRPTVRQRYYNLLCVAFGRRSDQVRQLHSHQSPGVGDGPVHRSREPMRVGVRAIEASIHHDHPKSARGSGIAEAGARHEMA